MNTRKLLAMTAAAAMTLTACSGSESTSDDTTGPSRAPATTAAATGTSGNDATDASEDATTTSEDVSGALSFYTSQPDADYQALVDGFNEQYPDVEVSVFRSGTEEVVSRVMAENEAGDVQADVILVADALNFLSLKDAGLLASYESPELSAIPDQYEGADAVYTGTKIIDTAIAINTNMVDEAPTSWQDLVDHADDLVMPSPQYSGAAAYNVAVLAREDGFGWDYWASLADGGAAVLQGNGGVLQDVAEGRHGYAIVVSFIVARAADEGSPVEVVYPEEGVLAITEPIGIMDNAQNRPAAEAFVDYVLGETGQQLAAELGYTPIREGIEPPEGLPSIEELDVIAPDDLGELASSQEDDVRHFVDLFGAS